MDALKQYLSEMTAEHLNKLVISHPKKKSESYRKIVINRKKTFYQFEKYTDKQVFHENVPQEQLATRCAELIEDRYQQVNAWSDRMEYTLLISKKGSCSFRKTPHVPQENVAPAATGDMHNRQKQYLLQEGAVIAPLVDMGVFTQEGKVVRSMYDKYRQINRFIELIDDAVRDSKATTLNVIDFGCGKSYLTFVVYYYLTQIRHITANIIGLDLKADVIEKCNATAQKYGYSGLRFELGDINGYKAPFEVDMVITLHACDTATDFALFNAIQWNARMIFSVPCCQHELNGQMQPKNLSILNNYGIVKERFAALATDAMRGNLLEYCGYKTQLLEFIDFEHTPKNILIRAMYRPATPKALRNKKMQEVRQLMDEFGFEPTLYRLIQDAEQQNS